MAADSGREVIIAPTQHLRQTSFGVASSTNSGSVVIQPDYSSAIGSRVGSWCPVSRGVSAMVLDEETAELEATGTAASASMQVMLTCLGIAALTMPHLYAQVGWGLGSFIVALPVTMSSLSMRQITFLGVHSGQRGMAGAFSPHLGGKVGLLLSWMVFILCEFIVAATVAIPCDILPKLGQQVMWIPDMSRHSVGLILLLVAALAGFASDLSALDKMLKPAISLIVYLMVYVVCNSILNGAGNDIEFIVLEHPTLSFRKRVLDAFSTAMAAYGAECAILAIYFNTAPQCRTPIETWSNKVIDIPMWILFFMYMVFGVAGYSEYGEGVQANLLNTMGTETWSIIAKLGLSLVNAFRVPLFNTVQWYTALDLFPVLAKYEKAWCGAVRSLVLTCMNCVSLMLYLGLSDFGRVLSIIGGILGMPIFTLLPGFTWLVARYMSHNPIGGSHWIMDISSIIIIITISIVYAFNVASYFP